MNEPENDYWDCPTCGRPTPPEHDYECGTCETPASHHLPATHLCKQIRMLRDERSILQVEINELKAKLEKLTQ